MLGNLHDIIQSFFLQKLEVQYFRLVNLKKSVSLRREAHLHNNVHRVLFSGGLLSRAALEASRSFCVSVIVGADIVPRITIQAVHKLREQVQVVVKTCGHFWLFGIE